MELIAPPDGRPWALIALASGSVLLNVVLGVALLLPSGSAPEAPAVDDASNITAAVVSPASDSTDVVETAPTPDAEEEPEPAVQTPALPPGIRAANARVERNLAYTFHKAVGEGSDAVSASTARLFVWDLDLRRDLQKGDSVAVAWSTANDLPVIEAARYTSKKLGKTLTAYRFQATGDAYASYWSADGTEVPNQLVGGPLKGQYEQITSLIKDRPTHAGMDFKAAVDTPVYTPRAGEVTRTNWNWTNNGNAVEVKWADGTFARFLHLNQTGVKVGQRVAAGERIGATGNTGKSTAPHLHYELEKAGKTVDPVDVHGLQRRRLSDADAGRFADERARLSGLLASES
ncbi:MAG: M23 family metallopeptidase [Myxococcota bacterium]